MWKKYDPRNYKRLPGGICLFLLFYSLQKFISVQQNLKLLRYSLKLKHVPDSLLEKFGSAKATLFSHEQ